MILSKETKMDKTELHPLAMPTSLDLFARPPIDVALESGEDIQYLPLTALDAPDKADTAPSPIEFVVPGQGSSYQDLASIHIRIKATVHSKTANVDKKCTLISLAPHALFKQIDLFLNGVLVSYSSSNYPYRAMIETLLGHTANVKKDYLSMAIWEEREGKHNENLDMVFHPNLDMMHQSRYLLPGVEIKLRLIPHLNTFPIKAGGDTDDDIFYLRLNSVNMLIKKVIPASTVLNAHMQTLHKTKAIYPIRRVFVKSHTVAQKTDQASLPNLILGQLPIRVIVGMVTSAAYSGTRASLNPFNFKHFNLDSIALQINGTSHPVPEYRPDFSTRQYSRSYLGLLQTVLGDSIADRSIGLSLTEWGKHPLWGWDLTPDCSANASHVHLMKRGDLGLQLHFSTALDEPIVILLYAEFENSIEIDSNRNIHLNFGN